MNIRVGTRKNVTKFGLVKSICRKCNCLVYIRFWKLISVIDYIGVKANNGNQCAQSQSDASCNENITWIDKLAVVNKKKMVMLIF